MKTEADERWPLPKTRPRTAATPVGAEREGLPRQARLAASEGKSPNDADIKNAGR